MARIEIITPLAEPEVVLYLTETEARYVMAALHKCEPNPANLLGDPSHDPVWSSLRGSLPYREGGEAMARVTN